jgi:hypothetical protein
MGHWSQFFLFLAYFFLFLELFESGFYWDLKNWRKLTLWYYSELTSTGGVVTSKSLVLVLSAFLLLTTVLAWLLIFFVLRWFFSVLDWLAKGLLFIALFCRVTTRSIWSFYPSTRAKQKNYLIVWFLFQFPKKAPSMMRYFYQSSRSTYSNYLNVRYSPQL